MDGLLCPTIHLRNFVLGQLHNTFPNYRRCEPYIFQRQHPPPYFFVNRRKTKKKANIGRIDTNVNLNKTELFKPDSKKIGILWRKDLFLPKIAVERSTSKHARIGFFRSTNIGFLLNFLETKMASTKNSASGWWALRMLSETRGRRTDEKKKSPRFQRI